MKLWLVAFPLLVCRSTRQVKTSFVSSAKVFLETVVVSMRTISYYDPNVGMSRVDLAHSRAIVIFSASRIVFIIYMLS